jgi:hypothetical protein
MFVRKFFALFLLLAGTRAWSQTQSSGENALNRGNLYAGPVFTGANPSKATFGAEGGVSFRVHHRIGVAVDFSTYTGTAGWRMTPRFSITRMDREFQRRFPGYRG